MKPSDALELVALLEERWPSLRLTDEQRRVYAEDVGPLDAAQARAALDVLHRAGGDFAPTSGKLIREVARLQLGAPEWEEVKRSLIERHVLRQTWEPPDWTCPAGKCDGSGIVETTPPERKPGQAFASNMTKKCECFEARKETRRLAETLHPLVREFIRDRYVSWAEIERLGEAAGTGDTTTLEAQIRAKWQSYAARAVESRAVAGIDAPPGLSRLEQARDEDARRIPSHRPGLPGRIDPLAHLPKAG